MGNIFSSNMTGKVYGIAVATDMVAAFVEGGFNTRALP